MRMRGGPIVSRTMGEEAAGGVDVSVIVVASGLEETPTPPGGGETRGREEGRGVGVAESVFGSGFATTSTPMPEGK